MKANNMDLIFHTILYVICAHFLNKLTGNSQSY